MCRNVAAMGAGLKLLNSASESTLIQALLLVANRARALNDMCRKQ